MATSKYHVPLTQCKENICDYFICNEKLGEIIEIKRLHVVTFRGRVVSPYRVFHGFGQAKFPDGGSVLGSSQF